MAPRAFIRMSFSILDCVAGARRRAARGGSEAIFAEPTPGVAGAGGAGVDPGIDGTPRASGRRPAMSETAALGGLSTDDGPCVVPGGVCASAPVVELIERFAAGSGGGAAPDKAGEAPDKAAGTSADVPAEDVPAEDEAAEDEAAETLARAAAIVGCPDTDGGACVLQKPQFQKFAARNGVHPAALAAELESRFKAVGPRDSRAQLSNFNIDDTLRRWAATVFPDFHPCPFAMMDFDDTREEFAVTDLVDVLEGRAAADLGPALGRVRRRSRTFACVVNTDYSSGPGKHWVAVFVDCRAEGPWTVEYFNSTGRPPPRQMVAWLERSRARLAAHRGPPGAAVEVVTDVSHQEGQTECGIYALFYIRHRLEGTPYAFFRGERITDDAVAAFRPHLFRHK